MDIHEKNSTVITLPWSWHRFRVVLFFVEKKLASCKKLTHNIVGELPAFSSYAWMQERATSSRNNLSWIPVVMRGIVHISPAKLAPQQKNNLDMPFPPGLPSLKIPFHKTWVPRRVPSDVFLPLPQVFGSGFFIDSVGHIVTNAHVLRFVMKKSHKEAQEKKQVIITLQGGDTAFARVVGVDPTSDIAVLRIEKDGESTSFFAPISWGDSYKIEEGEVVWSIGTPFGLEETLSQGIISHKQRHLSLEGVKHVDSYIQIDAPAINHGYSGAPLFNAQGDVIGIISTICTPNGGSVGISFAIPSHVARYVVESIIKKGHVPRGKIGIIAIPRKKCKSSLLPKGVVIEKIESKSPAHEAGLRSQDIITHINEAPIEDIFAFHHHLNTLQPEKIVEISFLRPPHLTTPQKKRLKSVPFSSDNDVLSVKNFPQSVFSMKIIAVDDLSDDIKKRYNFKNIKPPKGVMILSMEKDSPFASVCRPGDIILKIAPQGFSLRSVTTPRMAQSIFEEAMSCYHESIFMEIYRPHSGVFYTRLTIGSS